MGVGGIQNVGEWYDFEANVVSVDGVLVAKGLALVCAENTGEMCVLGAGGVSVQKLWSIGAESVVKHSFIESVESEDSGVPYLGLITCSEEGTSKGTSPEKLTEHNITYPSFPTYISTNTSTPQTQTWALGMFPFNA